MTLADRILSQIADLDSRIAFIQAKAADEIAALKRQQAVLTNALGFLTPDTEKAVRALENLGFITLK